MIRLFLITALLLSAASLSADISPEKRAQLAYDAQLGGKPEEAITVYESLLSEGYESADLHYNLGLTYYGQGRLGPAILHHEKALRLRPYDEAIQQNLRLLRNEQADGLTPLQPFFLTAAWNRLAARLSPNTWSLLAIVLAWLAGAAWVVWLFASERNRKRQGFWAGIALAILTLIPIGLAGSRKAELARSDQAVLVARESPLYIAPGEDAEVEMQAHEGLRVRLLDSFEEWYKVELVDGRQGWVKQEDVGVI